jgi:hypothetical protein
MLYATQIRAVVAKKYVELGRMLHRFAYAEAFALLALIGALALSQLALGFA